MPSIGKKLHHFVPRFYLKTWAKKNHIYCLQDGEIFRTNLRNVAGENHFYRLKELSPEDVEFIRGVAINDSPKELKASHEKLVQYFTLPYLAKRKLERTGSEAAEIMMEVDRMIAELNENFHTSIEDVFKPHLNSMLSGDLSFLGDPTKASTFYWGLAVQYLRTNHIKDAKLNMSPRRFDYYLKVANLLVHILAANLGFNMYVRREQNTIMLLDNRTEVPFITADQPVINIAAKPEETNPPQRFELYYPLSPKRALLLLEPSSEFLPESSRVSIDVAHFYNLRMAARSYRQIFSNSNEELKAIMNELPAFLSCL
jgi:hypothetical protein